MMTTGTIAFAPQIAAAAARFGLDPRLLAAVAAQETGGPGSSSGRNVVGDGGHGHGVFQIDDRWHSFAATPAAMDPAKNASYAASLLSGLLKTYGGDVHKALSAYNTGSPTASGTATDWGGRILGYADSVLAHYSRLGGAAPGAASGRDAAMPEATANAAAMNQLRALATQLAPPTPASPATAPVAAANTAPQARQHDEKALVEDLGLGDDAQT